jgi:hypothetical protein
VPPRPAPAGWAGHCEHAQPTRLLPGQSTCAAAPGSSHQRGVGAGRAQGGAGVRPLPMPGAPARLRGEDCSAPGHQAQRLLGRVTHRAGRQGRGGRRRRPGPGSAGCLLPQLISSPRCPEPHPPRPHDPQPPWSCRPLCSATQRLSAPSRRRAAAPLGGNLGPYAPARNPTKQHACAHPCAQRRESVQASIMGLRMQGAQHVGAAISGGGAVSISHGCRWRSAAAPGMGCWAQCARIRVRAQTMGAPTPPRTRFSAAAPGSSHQRGVGAGRAQGGAGVRPLPMYTRCARSKDRSTPAIGQTHSAPVREVDPPRGPAGAVR